MIQVIKADQRGHADHGWLNTYHTFSFANYYNPNMMGFRDLRVINEDRVKPGKGFGTHGHADMEILSYVVEGAIAHKDSTGVEEVLRPDEWQRMTAGTGVHHSEYNPSPSDGLHFYQIWILPEKKGVEPSYEQKMFPVDEKTGRLRLVASPDGRDGSLTINQNVSVYNALLRSGEEVNFELQKGRHAWIQVVRGSVEVNGSELDVSDGAAISDEDRLSIRTGGDQAEIILFDLA